jgi:hypothetical protein
MGTDGFAPIFSYIVTVPSSGKGLRDREIHRKAAFL